MNQDEELHHLRQANQDLREGLKQAISAIESQQERIKMFEGLIEAQQERIKTLEGQQAKDSHNSSLPPSSDRFVRLVKSLREPSGLKPGGQKGHRGHHLRQVKTPDEIFIHPIAWCEHCQHDLRAQQASLPERRPRDRSAKEAAVGDRTSGRGKAAGLPPPLPLSQERRRELVWEPHWPRPLRSLAQPDEELR